MGVKSCICTHFLHDLNNCEKCQVNNGESVTYISNRLGIPKARIQEWTEDILKQKVLNWKSQFRPPPKNPHNSYHPRQSAICGVLAQMRPALRRIRTQLSVRSSQLEALCLIKSLFNWQPTTDSHKSRPKQPKKCAKIESTLNIH